MAGFGEEHDDLKSQSGDSGCANDQESTTRDNVQHYQVGRNCGVSQRRKRTQYTPAQLDTLELFFQCNRYPTFHHREELAKTCASVNQGSRSGFKIEERGQTV